MKKLLSILLSILVLSTILVGCASTDEEKFSLKLIESVEDQYGNILNQTYINEDSGEYILREYVYSFQKGKWICIDQKTTIFNSPPVTNPLPTNNNLRIFYNNDLLDSTITIINNEYVEISIIRYLTQGSWWEFGYDLKIYNKTNEVLSTVISDPYILNIFCEPIYNVEHVNPGRTSYLRLVWDADTLKRCHVPYIDNIEFMIRVFNNQDWSAPAVSGERILLKK